MPALVSEATFALAQEQLERNKHHSPRRTIEPSLLQGMLVCERCGYSLYRTSTQTSARKLYYYRCLGSDAYRHLRGAVCDNPPVRQDHLDGVVWNELVRLLEDPKVIREELNRRLEAARKADPRKQREELLQREQARLEKSMDRLLNAYQEGLVSLEQLRARMPELRQQQQALQAERQSLQATSADQAHCLRLAETLTGFCAQLRSRANTLDVSDQQKILRLLVKEILVGKDTLVIRHSIPIPNAGSDPITMPRPPHAPPQSPMPQPGTHYLLRSGRHHGPLRRTPLCLRPLAFLHHPGLQPFLDQPENPAVGNAMLHELEHPPVGNGIEKSPNVCIKNVVHVLPRERVRERVQRLMLAASRTKPIRKAQKVFLVNRVEDGDHGLLDDLVLQCRNPQRTLPPVAFRDIRSSRGLRSIRPPVDPAVQIDKSTFPPGLILLPREAVYSRCRFSLQRVKALPQKIDR